MTVRYSARALGQIAEIVAKISIDDPGGAARFARRVESLAVLVSRHPAVGRQTSLAEIRVLPAKPFPYLVFYQPLPYASGIVVLRVRHMARKEDWRSGR